MHVQTISAKYKQVYSKYYQYPTHKYKQVYSKYYQYPIPQNTSKFTANTTNIPSHKIQASLQ